MARRPLVTTIQPPASRPRSAPGQVHTLPDAGVFAGPAVPGSARRDSAPSHPHHPSHPPRSPPTATPATGIPAARVTSGGRKGPGRAAGTGARWGRTASGGRWRSRRWPCG